MYCTLLLASRAYWEFYSKKGTPRDTNPSNAGSFWARNCIRRSTRDHLFRRAFSSKLHANVLDDGIFSRQSTVLHRSFLAWSCPVASLGNEEGYWFFFEKNLSYNYSTKLKLYICLWTVRSKDKFTSDVTGNGASIDSFLRPHLSLWHLRKKERYFLSFGIQLLCIFRQELIVAVITLTCLTFSTLSCQKQYIVGKGFHSIGDKLKHDIRQSFTGTQIRIGLVAFVTE